MKMTIEAYTESQFNNALEETISKLLMGYGIHSVDRPMGILLGGQSGAGKSTLHRIYRERLSGNVIVINGDEYRKLHPNFHLIQQHYGLDAPAHTARWAGAMTEALIDALSQQRFNLVIEGTLRTSDVPLKTAALLRERGYSTSLAIMAVKPEISLLSCQVRYELMRLAGTTPRATDPQHHDKIVHDIVENLAVLEESGQFEEVLLYNRSEERLYPAASAQPTACETLRSVLFGPWSAEETSHYETLQRQLRDLKSQ